MKVTYTELKGKAEQGYGVTRWANAKEINQSLAELTSQPIYSVSEEAYKDICDNYYNVQCAGSKKITAEAKKYIPGGVQHNLAFNKPFPMCMTKAEGAYLYDIDGNKYIDFLQAGGPTILGSNYPAVQEEAIKLIKECGPVTGLFHEAEMLIAKEINKCMPNVEKFRMLGSGTESVMGAIRVARCYTKKKRIIKIGGAYHGWSDQMVYGLKVPGTRQFLESFGIPNVIFSVVDEVRPNDLDMLEDYLKYNAACRGGTAAVIVEPVGPESGTRPVDFDYNAGVRALCDKYGALFIFDEVVTGFRVGIGGAQGLFNVKPDLTIFGKIVAGGYPAAGGIGGRADVVDLLAVDRDEAVAVAESHPVARLVEVVAPAGLVVREVGLAPRVADADVDRDGQQNVHHHAGDHHQKALPGGLGPELPGLHLALLVLLVHRLVDHARDLDVAAQRQPAQSVFGVPAAELEEREPRVEEDVELLDADAEDARHDEVSQLVDTHEDREAEEELKNLDDEFHGKVFTC